MVRSRVGCARDRSGPRTRSERLEQIAELIASVQRDDGYLHTPTFISERNDEDVTALADRFNFETYNLGHLITAGVRHCEVTGSDDAARRPRRRRRPSSRTSRTTSPSSSPAAPSARRTTWPSSTSTAPPTTSATCDSPEAFVRVRDEFDEGGDDNQDRIPVREQTVVAGPRRARQLPLRRSRRPRRRDRRRAAHRRAREPLARRGRHQALHHRRLRRALRRRLARRLPVAGRDQPGAPGVRPRVPAAQHDRARGVVREHRHDPVGRADAVAHAATPATPMSSSGSPSTACSRASASRARSTSTRMRSARCATCRIPFVVRATPASTPCRRPRRRTSGCASAISAASAARRTSRARSRASTSVRPRSRPTGCTCTSTAAASSM